MWLNVRVYLPSMPETLNTHCLLLSLLIINIIIIARSNNNLFPLLDLQKKWRGLPLTHPVSHESNQESSSLASKCGGCWPPWLSCGRSQGRSWAAVLNFPSEPASSKCVCLYGEMPVECYYSSQKRWG